MLNLNTKFFDNTETRAPKRRRGWIILGADATGAAIGGGWLSIFLAAFFSGSAAIGTENTLATTLVKSNLSIEDLDNGHSEGDLHNKILLSVMKKDIIANLSPIELVERIRTETLQYADEEEKEDLLNFDISEAIDLSSKTVSALDASTSEEGFMNLKKIFPGKEENLEIIRIYVDGISQTTNNLVLTEYYNESIKILELSQIPEVDKKSLKAGMSVGRSSQLLWSTADNMLPLFPLD